MTVLGFLTSACTGILIFFTSYFVMACQRLLCNCVVVRASKFHEYSKLSVGSGWRLVVGVVTTTNNEHVEYTNKHANIMWNNKAMSTYTKGDPTKELYERLKRLQMTDMNKKRLTAALKDDHDMLKEEIFCGLNQQVWFHPMYGVQMSSAHMIDASPLKPLLHSLILHAMITCTLQTVQIYYRTIV